MCSTVGNHWAGASSVSGWGWAVLALLMLVVRVGCIGLGNASRFSAVLWCGD